MSRSSLDFRRALLEIRLERLDALHFLGDQRHDARGVLGVLILGNDDQVLVRLEHGGLDQNRQLVGQIDVGEIDIDATVLIRSLRHFRML